MKDIKQKIVASDSNSALFFKLFERILKTAGRVKTRKLQNSLLELVLSS